MHGVHSGCVVKFYFIVTTNQWLTSGTRGQPTHIMALVRLLYICAVHHQLNVCVVHVPGVCNDIADALSHFQMEKFQKLAPTANQMPDNTPA